MRLMSNSHLIFSGQSATIQMSALRRLVGENAGLMHVLKALRATDLPDVLVGGGAIYQTVWNGLTGRPLWQGVRDIDIIYHDASDLSWETEDRVIRATEHALGETPVPIEVRNQARVHLWFGQKFGHEVEPLRSSGEALLRYVAETHAVAVRLEPDDTLHVEAPFELDAMFSFRLAPNRRSQCRQTYMEKGARIKAVWPEVTIEPWRSRSHEEEGIGMVARV